LESTKIQVEKLCRYVVGGGQFEIWVLFIFVLLLTTIYITMTDDRLFWREYILILTFNLF